MVTTIINGNKRVTVSEDIRQALGLEDGVEYVVERSSGAVTSPPTPEQTEALAGVGLTRASDKQIHALERMLASRRRFDSTRVLTDEDWDKAIGWAIAEDFRNEDYGNDAGDGR